jgi:hypothetical protein
MPALPVQKPAAYNEEECNSLAGVYGCIDYFFLSLSSLIWRSKIVQ